MVKTDIIIIGAGAAGLMAALKLSAKNKNVIVLEARDRIGGRVNTVENSSNTKNVELGAEFIHGDLPVTLNLLEEAGIKFSPAGGNMVTYKDGRFTKDDHFIEGWDMLIQKLKELKEDMTLYEFLQQYFNEGKYEALRDSIIRFVSGYDTADQYRASCFALLKEWQNEDDDAQHRIDSGYCSLMDYMAAKITTWDGQIHLDSIVKEIDWKPGDVKVITDKGTLYSAEKLVIALPLGVLQTAKKEKASVSFHPAIKEQNRAINDIGFGAIIKVLLEFDTPFWEQHDDNLKDVGFLFSNEMIPTWWTQAPAHSPLLTGWLGGPAAAAKKGMTEEELLHAALISLGNIFKMDTDELKSRLKASHAVNWTADAFTLGSYSYDTVPSAKAKAVLNKPVEDTLFFTGEYLYDGPAMGTVEAALSSGEGVARMILGKS
jgi:monoamine oxidase